MGRYTEQVSAPSLHSELWVVRNDTFDPVDEGSTTDLLQDVTTQNIWIHATVQTKTLTSVLSQRFTVSFTLSLYEISPV
jgi:hypothetical protein